MAHESKRTATPLKEGSQQGWSPLWCLHEAHEHVPPVTEAHCFSHSRKTQKVVCMAS